MFDDEEESVDDDEEEGLLTVSRSVNDEEGSV